MNGNGIRLKSYSVSVEAINEIKTYCKTKSCSLVDFFYDIEHVDFYQKSIFFQTRLLIEEKIHFLIDQRNRIELRQHGKRVTSILTSDIQEDLFPLYKRIDRSLLPSKIQNCKITIGNFGIGLIAKQKIRATTNFKIENLLIQTKKIEINHRTYTFIESILYEDSRAHHLKDDFLITGYFVNLTEK